MITYDFLQHYWWLLIALIGGFFAFLLFVQGGQSLLLSLPRDAAQRNLMLNVLGRKWSITFTTLVTFGGAFFASFPLFYSTSFGGAYWVWMLILVSFVLQAVSYEVMDLPGNLLGAPTYRSLLFFNGFVGTFVVGVVLATFFTGAGFTVEKGNILQLSSPVISRWATPWHGLEALANPRNLCLGFAVFFLARTLALMLFVNRIQHDELERRCRRFLWYNALPFVVFFVAFVVWTFLSKGFAVDPQTGEVFMQPYKYFRNMVEMPVVGIVFVAGVLAVLYGIGITLFCPRSRRGIWPAGIGTVAAVCSLLLTAGYNHTAFYPSYTDLQSSLTIFNASSSEMTLGVMAIVSLIIPIVLAYIVIAWRSMEKRRTDLAEIEGGGGY